MPGEGRKPRKTRCAAKQRESSRPGEEQARAAAGGAGASAKGQADGGKGGGSTSYFLFSFNFFFILLCMEFWEEIRRRNMNFLPPWGRNFKTSNGSLKTLPTSIRGRLWKVCFLGPRHGSAGSPVICDGPERVSQGPAPELQNVQRALKNDPHVDSWTSLESMLSGTQTRFRRVPSDLRGSRTGFAGARARTSKRPTGA